MKKRADGRYQLSVIVGYGDRGKPLRKTVYGKTIREVEDKAAELRYQVSQGTVIRGQDVTVSALAKLWLEMEKAPVVKPQTLLTLGTSLKHIDKYLGTVRVSELDIGHIEHMREEMVNLGHICSYNLAQSALKAILNFGIRHGYLTRNVTLGLPLLKDPNKKVKRALTPFEIKAIKSAKLEPATQVLMDVLRYGGLRLGEASALDVKDFDQIRREVTISKTMVAPLNTVQNSPKTSAGLRVIPLPPVFWERNGEYLASRRPSEPLFMTSTYKRKSIFTVRKMFTDAMADIFNGNPPEDLTPHLFRHNYASELYASGIMKDDIKTAQYLLGHQDIKTTLDVYTHLDRGKIDRSRLDDYYNVSQKLVRGKMEA